MQRQYDAVGPALGHHRAVTAELPRQGGREAAARRAAAGTGQPAARSARQDGAWAWIEPLVAKRASRGGTGADGGVSAVESLEHVVGDVDDGPSGVLGADHLVGLLLERVDERDAQLRGLFEGRDRGATGLHGGLMRPDDLGLDQPRVDQPVGGELFGGQAASVPERFDARGLGQRAVDDLRHGLGLLGALRGDEQHQGLATGAVGCWFLRFTFSYAYFLSITFHLHI